MIALAIALMLQTPEDLFGYTSSDGSLEISGLSKGYEFSYRPQGAITASGSGSPALIKLNSSGLTIRANRLSGTAEPLDKKTYFLKRSQTAETSQFIMDSAIARAFREKSRTVAPTTTETETNRFELDSDRTDYEGSANEGELKIPSALMLTSHGEGTRAIQKNNLPMTQSYLQDLSLHASSGRMTVDPRPNAGIHAIKSGEFEGPVTFSSIRTETIKEEKSKSRYTLNGHCDRLRIVTDATGETIFAEGNVDFVITDDMGTLHLGGKQVRFRFDSSLEPVEAEGLGAPFKTTYPIKVKQR